MTFRTISAIFWTVFAAFSFAFTTPAQGVIIPIICDVRPCPRPSPPPVPLPNALPVKSIRLDTKINGQVATTHVEQVFRNDTGYTLEGIYFFPIPETASIVEFAIWENGKKLVGEVRQSGVILPSCSERNTRIGKAAANGKRDGVIPRHLRHVRFARALRVEKVRRDVERDTARQS